MKRRIGATGSGASSAMGRAGSGRGALAVLAVMLSLSGAARARKRKPKPGPPADLPGHVNYLIRRAYGLSLQEAEPSTDQIQTLVLDHMDAWIRHRTPSFVEVRQELEKAFSRLRYPFYAQCSAFSQPWKGSEIIAAGYSVGWNEYDRVNVVAIYQSAAGETRRVAVTHFVPRTDLNYLAAPGGPAGDLRFFVWGTRPGKAQPRLTAILYSFDGRRLAPMWEKKDVYDGKIALEDDRLTLTYVNESEYVNAVERNSLPPRHERIYRLGGKGPQFEAERDLPF